MTTVDTTTITVELPEAFDRHWNRLPSNTVDGKHSTVDPAQYFLRFETASRLVIDRATVRSDLPHVTGTEASAVEQTTLDFINAHSHPTTDAGEAPAQPVRPR
ncbi:hypothetical protein ACFC1R_37305 [Kitasatospora sp. NPDC056138]|uniref:hypothetical protein n=1 Tax=Kitasatospora sp. NPDC056138 TaxID=3345724 RepID=UPI0035E3B3DA